MRFTFAISLLSIYLLAGESFTPSLCRWGIKRSVLFSTTNQEQATTTKKDTQESVASTDFEIDIADIFPMPDTKEEIFPLTAEEINARLDRQLAKLRAKDQNSKQLSAQVRSVEFCGRSHARNIRI